MNQPLVGLPNEPWLAGYIPPSGRLALDVGANVGDVTAALIQRFDQVHCFEPQPAAHMELVRRFPDCAKHIHPVALGARHGEAQLTLYANSVHGSLVADDSEFIAADRGAPTDTVTVPIRTLDGLGYAAKPVDFVKIDVEGAEADVLQGARRTLAQNMPQLLIEVHSPRFGVECIAILSSVGYQHTVIPHPHTGLTVGHYWIHCPRP